MSISFSFQELNADQGTNTADGLRNVANTAANFVCNAYRNYSDATVGLPDPTGLGAFNNALYSRLCGPRNSNPTTPPAVPFSGGQCDNLPYNVTINFRRPDNSTGSVFYGSVLGPISGVGTKSTGANSGAYGVLAPRFPVTGILSVVSAGGPNWRDAIANYTVTSVNVVPVGHSDNCGNPSPQYRSPSPPGNTYNTNVNVNVGAGLVINAPVTIIPTLIKAGIEINPQIQVDVGPFNVNFDMGGVQIKPNFQIGNDRSTPGADYRGPGVPAPREPAPIDCDVDVTEITNEVTNISNSISNLDEKVDDIKDCACPVPYQVQAVALGSGQAGYAALPANTTRVRLTLTQIPVNAKYQGAIAPEPELYFAGYFYWGDGVGRTERIAVNAQNGVYFPPEWATAFGWTLYGGYDCNVQAFRAVPDKAGAQFASLQMKNPPA